MMKSTDDGDVPWGWLAAGMCCFGNVLTHYVYYAPGILYLEWLDKFDEGGGMTSWVGSMAMALSTLLGPAASMIANRWSHRTSVMLGGAVAATGILAGGFVNSIYELLFTYGVLGGIGIGIAFVPICTAPMRYFRKPRDVAIASGVTMSGTGIAGILFPPLLEKLREVYTGRGALIISAGLALNMCVCGAFLRPSHITFNLEQVDTKRQMNCLGLHVFRNGSFRYLLLSTFLFSLGFSCTLVYFVPLLEMSSRIDGSASSFAMSAMGFANTIAKLVLGFTARLQCLDLLSQFMCLCFTAGITILVLPAISNYAAIIVLTCLVGIGQAATATPRTLLVLEYVGDASLTSGYGFNCLIGGVGLITGAPIAGLIYDLTKSYTNSMYFGGSSIVLAGLVMIKVWVKSKCSCKKMHFHEVDIAEEE